MYGFKSHPRCQLSFVRDIKACEPPKVESTQCDLIEKARLGFNKHTSDKCLFVQSLKAPCETAHSTKICALYGGVRKWT